MPDNPDNNYNIPFDDDFDDDLFEDEEDSLFSDDEFFGDYDFQEDEIEEDYSERNKKQQSTKEETANKSSTEKDSVEKQSPADKTDTIQKKEDTTGTDTETHRHTDGTVETKVTKDETTFKDSNTPVPQKKDTRTPSPESKDKSISSARKKVNESSKNSKEYPKKTVSPKPDAKKALSGIKDKVKPKNENLDKLKQIKAKAQKVKESAKKVKEAAKKVKNIVKGAKNIKNAATLASVGLYALIALVVIYIVILIAAAFLSTTAGVGTRAGKDQENSWFATAAPKGVEVNVWATPGFAEDWEVIGYSHWQPGQYDIGGAGVTAEGVNILASMPERTKDLRDVDGRFIANAMIPYNAAVPENNKDDHVVCMPGMEMHLATEGSLHNPWATHLEWKGLAESDAYCRADVYMTGVHPSFPTYGLPTNTQICSKAQWEAAGSPLDVVFHPGASFVKPDGGGMSPETEQFYINMRWPYYNGWTYYPDSGGEIVGKRSDYFDKKVVVVNTVTKKMAIAIVGEWGPAKDLGVPKGNRMVGMSPDLMYYLTDGNPGDNKTLVEIAFAVDQSLPAGPFIVGSGGGNIFCNDWVRPAQGSNRTYDYRGPTPNGLQASFYDPLNALLAEASAAGFNVSMGDAFRTSQQQQNMIDKYGLISEGGRAAPLGSSCHEYGIACDLKWSTGPSQSAASKAGVQWVYANAPKYGLRIVAPWPNKECWHIQPLKKTNGSDYRLLYEGQQVKP